MVEITFEDANGVQTMFSLLPKELDKVLQSTVKKVTNQVQRRVQDTLKTYPRHKPRISHKQYKPYWTPSPPGQPPAQISTNLRRSVVTRPIIKHGFGDYEQSVTNTAVYARAQELGVPGRLPARPFVAPTINRMRSSREVERLFEYVVQREIAKRYASQKA